MNEERTTLVAAGHRLEARALSGKGPTLVYLHEGLGSVAQWRDLPDRVANALGFPALVYSRAGYGGSDPVALPRPVRFMHDEAEGALPDVLRAAGIGDFILVGHSDGASIALLYAGRFASPRLRGVVAIAPHVFVEERSVRAIAAARVAYEQGDLRVRLAKYHGENVDCAFRGWNDVWLSPEFRAWNIERECEGITCPVLVLQGLADEYGTTGQVERLAARCSGRVEARIWESCGHSPQRDRTEETIAAIVAFARTV